VCPTTYIGRSRERMEGEFEGERERREGKTEGEVERRKER
jgi:hypothetical protein